MDRPLFFLHVPRTGGTSLLSYLDQQFAPGEVCPAHEQHEFEALEAEGRLGGYKFYRGHFGVNFADHVPEHGDWITWLRDPVERAISTWRHMRRSAPMLRGTGRPAHIVSDAENARDLAFPDFCSWLLDQGRLSFFNQATAALARGRGWGMSAEEARRLDEETLALAVQNLSRFAFVGRLEHYASDLGRLQSLLGVPLSPPLTLHAAPPYDYGGEAARERLSELTRFDRALYTSVSEAERTVPSDPLYLKVS